MQMCQESEALDGKAYEKGEALKDAVRSSVPNWRPVSELSIAARVTHMVFASANRNPHPLPQSEPLPGTRGQERHAPRSS